MGNRRAAGATAVIPLSEARAVVMDACRQLAPRTVALDDALGCVLATPVAAAVDVPPFANAAMDGYAVRAGDVAGAPVTLRVVGRVLAGATLGVAVGPGEAARIMTGAPMPEGADAVCMVERTRAADGPGRAGTHGDERAERGAGAWDEQAVVIEAPVHVGENVRSAGSDVGAGDLVLGAGASIGPTQLAALVSAGVEAVAVVPRPRVGVISTGDELVDPGLPLGPAQIYDSNRPMLVALVDEAGCTSVDLGRSQDDEDALARRIEDALGTLDALVLSGGVSVGDVDVVRMVLERLGAGTTRWMQIAIRPAKPFSFTVLRGPGGPVPTFGLPGNPVSSAVSFELLVRPALRAMAAQRVIERPRCTARAEEPMPRRRDGRTYFVRVQLAPAGATVGAPGGAPAGAAGGAGGEPRWVARPCPGQGSHQIRSMGLADGLAVLADGEGVDAGELVEVIVTNPAIGAAFAGAPSS